MKEKQNNQSIGVRTDFESGGGKVEIVQKDPLSIEIIPHNEGQASWSQVWWYFKLEGIDPGTNVILRLVIGNPKIDGISPQAFFSYDQQTWALTDIGREISIDGAEYFEYSHKIWNSEVYFAYDLPYTPDHAMELMNLCSRASGVEEFELCRTKKNRKVGAMKYHALQQPRFGIWLQARAHAFESGSSWVLHELAIWLVSNDPRANALRQLADIYIVPIIDVDAVVEGRTGKYQKPYDHWMNWHNEPHLWEEIRAIKAHLKQLAEDNLMDLFIGFHGPGSKSNPFFLTPFERYLPYEKQKKNRQMFFESLNSELMTTETKKTESMIQILYSEREWDKKNSSSSHEWVWLNTNDHCIAFTLEVNMNTPFSTHMGYRSEAISLGKAMSNYFINSKPLK